MNKHQEPSPYDKRHVQNIAAYERAVDKIYREAIKEAVALSGIAGKLDTNKPFTFDDYPNTRKRIDNLINKLKKNIQLVILNGIRSEWTLANNKNNELANRVFGDNIGKLTSEQYKRYYNNNGNAREAFVARKENGLNLSQRVWNYGDQFKDELEMGLDIGLRDGRSADDINRDIRGYLKHPDKLFRRVRDVHGVLHLSKSAKTYHPGRGVYRSSYKNARRLAVTETNMAYRTADHLRWLQMDFVVGVRISLSNNHTLNGQPFTDICDELQGAYPKDFKFVGWHPHCRCFATPIHKTRKEILEDTKRILNGEVITNDSVNKVSDVPHAYKKWLKANEERIKAAEAKGTLPYFLKDNEKYYKAKPTPPQEIAKQRHASRTAKDIADIQRRWNKRKSEVQQEDKLQDIIALAQSKKIQYKEVVLLKQTLTEERIIERLAGGDETKGSCSSLAFAYAGNRLGYDVLDFRGGKSQAVFSSGQLIADIAKSVGGLVVQEYNDFNAANLLLQAVGEGKEYYFAIGRHAAIIRKAKRGYEYLELQSDKSTENGFKTLNENELRKRFKAKKKYSIYGYQYEVKSCLIDIDLLRSVRDFKQMLGYINTDKQSQKKGAMGGVK